MLNEASFSSAIQEKEQQIGFKSAVIDTYSQTSVFVFRNQLCSGTKLNEMKRLFISKKENENKNFNSKQLFVCNLSSIHIRRSRFQLHKQRAKKKKIHL